jgi:peptidoglycan/LPS O-acetylase OafA/YrhL
VARTLEHRPALDGLRGLAVAAVVVYHLEPDLLPGGFLGVSLFFTLSGFLIGNLLLAEWQADGRVDLGRFWSRRFRRLLPAALITLVLVVALAISSSEQSLLENLRGDILASLGYVANWRFVLNGDLYGAGFEQPSPVLHFWSLAIEEQFYIVVAIAAVLLARHSTRRRTWGIVFGGAALASMAATLVLFDPRDTNRVYFGSDTRALELLAGVLLAVVAGFAVPRWLAGRPWRHAVGGFTLTLLVAAFVLVETGHTWLYRGGFWLVALGSVALIVAAVDDGPLARGLSWRPLAALGLISYGVYLYHWPLFAWLSPERTGLDGVPLAAVRIGATLALAIASFVLVERPIRQGTFAIPARPVIATATAVAVAAVAIAGASWLGGQADSRAVAASSPSLQLNTAITAPPVSAPPGVGAASDAGEMAAAVGPDTAASATAPTEPDAPPRPPLQRVLFLGDSLMHQSFPTIRDRLATVDVDARAIGGPGQHLMTDNGVWLGELEVALRDYEPDLVVLEACCGWGSPWMTESYRAPDGRTIKPDTPDSWQEWERLAAAATDLARADGRPVAWVLAPPAQTNGYYGPIEGRIGLVNSLYQRLVSCRPGTGVIDWRVMSGPDGGFAWELRDSEGSPVRIRSDDGLHFTSPGQAAVADLTRDAVLALWQRPQRATSDAPPIC